MSTSFFQVKVVHVFMDDAAISPSEGFLIRKGPGNCHFDFAQEILFIDFLQTPTDNRSAEDYHKYGPEKSWKSVKSLKTASTDL